MILDIPESVLAAGVALLALLMVSPIPYRSFKEIDFRHSYGTLVLVVVTLVLVGIQWDVSLFAVGLVYTISGPVEWIWRWRTKRPLEEISTIDSPVPAERDPDRMIS